MRHALGVLGILAAGVLLAVSAAMNYRFGLSLGKTELDGQIYGVASAAADCMKALVPFFFFAAVKNRAWSQAAASMLVWAVVTAYSLTSAFGHAALNRFDVAGQRAHQSDIYKDTRSELASVKEQLSWIPKHRPIMAVKSEIDGLKSHRRWDSTKSCTDATATKSIAFCDKYRGLVAELASAEKAATLDARILKAQTKLASFDGISVNSSADPQATVLAKLTGVDLEKVQLAMTVFVALLLEVGSAFGMYIAFSQWRIYERHTPAAPKMATVSTAAAAVAVAEEKPQLPVAIEKPRSGANDNPVETTEEEVSAAPPRLVAPENDVERFYKEKVETQDGSSLTATALYEEYCDWCDAKNKEPLALPTFGRDFGELGVQKAKIAGRVRYIGIALKSEVGLKEDKNAPAFSVKAA